MTALPDPAEKDRFVERMFDGIAPRYDLMNRLMTLGVDRGWRRRAVAALALRPGDRVLDLGCGTGDLSAQAARAGARVVGIDVSVEMLRRAVPRVPAGFARADAQSLPLRDASCDAVVSGFALRNFTSVPRVLGESARVARPGARIALLEVDVPKSAPARLAFKAYMGGLVPLLGRVVSRGYAYEYLSDSLVYLPSDAELRDLLASVGFDRIEKRSLGMGGAQLVTAVRM